MYRELSLRLRNCDLKLHGCRETKKDPSVNYYQMLGITDLDLHRPMLLKMPCPIKA